MKIILTRHGETEQRRDNARSSSQRLNRRIISQTKKLAQRLKNEKVDFIYSSYLLEIK